MVKSRYNKIQKIGFLIYQESLNKKSKNPSVFVNNKHKILYFLQAIAQIIGKKKL